MTQALLVAVLVAATARAADEDFIQAESDQDRIGRVSAELGAGLLGAALPQLLWVPFLLIPRAESTPAIFALVTGAALTPVSISTAVWLVHRKLGGQGYWASAFGGTVLGAALGAGAFALYAYVSNFGRAEYAVLAGAGGAVLVIAATTFMIELHHDRRVSAAFAPIPGGAFGALTVRF